jgi:hypothetical protein
MFIPRTILITVHCRMVPGRDTWLDIACAILRSQASLALGFDNGRQPYPLTDAPSYVSLRIRHFLPTAPHEYSNLSLYTNTETWSPVMSECWSSRHFFPTACSMMRVQRPPRARFDYGTNQTLCIGRPMA